VSILTNMQVVLLAVAYTVIQMVAVLAVIGGGRVARWWRERAAARREDVFLEEPTPEESARRAKQRVARAARIMARRIYARVIAGGILSRIGYDVREIHADAVKAADWWYGAEGDDSPPGWGE
jgi:hypothetical protein